MYILNGEQTSVLNEFKRCLIEVEHLKEYTAWTATEKEQQNTEYATAKANLNHYSKLCDELKIPHKVKHEVCVWLDDWWNMAEYLDRNFKADMQEKGIQLA